MQTPRQLRGASNATLRITSRFPLHGMRTGRRIACWLLLLLMLAGGLPARHVFGGDNDAAEPVSFEKSIAPIFAGRCLACHNANDAAGGLSLATASGALAGGDSGTVIEPGNVEASLLIDYLSGDDPAMPKEDDPLSADEVEAIGRWIASGAKWPDGLVLKAKDTWWSRQPLVRPAVPEPPAEQKHRLRTPIDAFITAKLHANGMMLSAEADRRTLIRRLYFDLIGLPPTAAEIEQFQNDSDPLAYEKLVDALLDSPHYGERWARHWLDLVHYADTMGFDKDKLRRHAWPYRDYVIRTFNDDKPYSRFVKEQLAGDVFYPGTTDGIVGLGFLAAGPFDWVGQIEVADGSMEKRRVRNLDRDDMVASTMSTFVSTTAHCARCHDHKFDPIPQLDYYRLQAVFAAVDRADRPYDADSEVASRRHALRSRGKQIARRKQAINSEIQRLAGEELAKIEQRLAEALAREASPKRPQFGYHSQIEPRDDAVKWVQIDLGRPTRLAKIVYVGCHDDFAGIGAGFGFPLRYKIEASDDPAFARNVTLIADHTQADMPNPGVEPQSIALGRDGQEATLEARYVRITATKLAHRQNDYIFALAELLALTPAGENAAAGASVTALDSIEAPVRWSKANLVDGYYYEADTHAARAEAARLSQQRDALLDSVTSDQQRRQLARLDAEGKQVEAELAALPTPSEVYAAATEFPRQGNFVPTGGEPRPIYLLRRGSEDSPDLQRGLVQPGALSTLSHLDDHFHLPADNDEAARRAALAEWIVDRDNPLTWRSIVNRVWLHHFGRGIVDSPNDFGRMGRKPTHGALLDWLAVEFRDGRQSFKELHRLICTSSVYRQASTHQEQFHALDAENRFLWRMNRRRLSAEAIRDSVLATAAKLDRRMGGAGFRTFGFQDDHSPHYLYHEHDPDDPASHRRSIYRVIVRSVPDPLMTTLDCADPSINVAQRSETLTALQALALLNNPFMVRMAEHFAARVDAGNETLPEKIDSACRLALGRSPTRQEQEVLVAVAAEHGMANACRLILNLNEFVFID